MDQMERRVLAARAQAGAVAAIAPDETYIEVEWLSDQEVELGPQQTVVRKGDTLLMRRSEAIGRSLAHPTPQVRIVPEKTATTTITTPPAADVGDEGST